MDVRWSETPVRDIDMSNFFIPIKRHNETTTCRKNGWPLKRRPIQNSDLINNFFRYYYKTLWRIDGLQQKMDTPWSEAHTGYRFGGVTFFFISIKSHLELAIIIKKDVHWIETPLRDIDLQSNFPRLYKTPYKSAICSKKLMSAEAKRPYRISIWGITFPGFIIRHK